MTSQTTPPARFSIVLFASEQMTRRYPLRWLRIALCQRLMASGQIEVKGLFIDRPPPKKQPDEDRLKQRYTAEVYNEYLAAQALEPTDTEVPFSCAEACKERGIPLYELDLNSDEARQTVAQLDPDLGILFGCRILHDATVSAPRFGTLNFHARDAERFRGGGALGYWELLEAEKDIQITIHEAVARVDAGAILATSRLAIDACDTLESLLLKTVIRGVDLYAQTILDFANGQRETRPQQSEARTYRRDLITETIYRNKRRQVLLEMPRYQGQSTPPDLWASAPSAQTTQAQGALILAYPLIANNPSHPMNLPYEVFVGQLQWLQRHFQIVSLADVRNHLSQKDEGKPVVAITLDGGFAQDLTAALSFVQAFEIPTTLFVSPDACARRASLCEQTLLTPEDIKKLAQQPWLDLGLLSDDHFAHFGAAPRQGAFAPSDASKELLQSWTGQPVELAALPYQFETSAPKWSGTLLDLSGAWNSTANFDGHRLHRVAAPSSVTALAALFER